MNGLTGMNGLTDMTKQATRQHLIQSAVDSLVAIPATELPDEEARAALIALARRGLDVRAYQQAVTGQYVIWIEPPEPEQDGRWEPAEWAEQWRTQQRRHHTSNTPVALRAGSEAGSENSGMPADAPVLHFL
jgi:hypothetical protein